MSTDEFNITHTILNQIQVDVSAIRDDIGDVKLRLTTLEVGQAGILQFISHHDASIAHQQAALDLLNKRIDRIERRLELTDTP
jgi:uncharacterized coiled-coil protein SlyX